MEWGGRRFRESEDACEFEILTRVRYRAVITSIKLLLRSLYEDLEVVLEAAAAAVEQRGLRSYSLTVLNA